MLKGGEERERRNRGKRQDNSRLQQSTVLFKQSSMMETKTLKNQPPNFFETFFKIIFFNTQHNFLLVPS